jgi:hypothetical protein
MSQLCRFCSLMGQGRQLGYERYRRWRVLFSKCHAALDGVAGCGAASLKSQSEMLRRIGRMLQNRRRHPLPTSGVAPARELRSASCRLAGDRQGCFELGALPGA